MTIDHIKIHTVDIPFKSSISHNLKNSTHSAPLILAIHTKSGKIGYGESVLCNSTAKKSVKRGISHFKNIFAQYVLNDFFTLEDIKDVCSWINRQHHLPVMATALESALLDLLRQERGYSIAKFLSPKNYPVQHAVVIPYLPVEQLEYYLHFIKEMQVNHVKITLGDEDDLTRIAKARQMLDEHVSIQVDAQNGWTFSEASRKINDMQAFNISHVEEPLVASQADKLPVLSTKIDIPIILSRSVDTHRRAVHFSNKIAADKLLFNLNISDSGGLFNVAAFHRLAQSNDIHCQLATTFGETTIIRAVRRLFAQTHPLHALEISLDSFFMEEDLNCETVVYIRQKDR